MQADAYPGFHASSNTSACSRDRLQYRFPNRRSDSYSARKLTGGM